MLFSFIYISAVNEETRADVKASERHIETNVATCSCVFYGQLSKQDQQKYHQLWAGMGPRTT